ncbi:MAG: long-chain fatty acid--CoA ligase [Bacteroidales bacterium]|nr:long-chain fatty acid--CoA ligase [Bacteroidales bacterium]
MGLQFTYDVVDHCVERFPHHRLFYVRKGGKWKGIGAIEFAESVRKLSLVFLSEGIRRGECVASIFSYNSYEWNIIDMALATIGAVHVPVYPTISDSDYHFILTQAEVRWVFITDQALYNKLARLRSELPDIENIISIEKLPCVDHFDELLSRDLLHTGEYEKDLAGIRTSIHPDDICAILYTSGTTGIPKGVMLSHRNLCTNTEAAAASQPLTEGHRALCFLPLCHIYQRTAVYQFIYKGVEVYYAESFKSVMANMREVSPDGTTVVPRVLEKILNGFYRRAYTSRGIKKMISLWAIRFGHRYQAKARSRIQRFKHSVADKLIYHHVRAVLGGRLSYVGCGGAPVDANTLRFFWSAGIPVYEGYGLTETSPLIAVNSPGEGNLKIGTVGKAVQDVAIDIAEDGEIWVKGPNIMKGYYKNPELTAETMRGEWLATGDFGEWTGDSFLRIIGRKKEMFKTSYGKYIVPQAIENYFVSSQLIENLIVIGEGKHFAVAIVSPNMTYARSLLPPDFTGKDDELVTSPLVRSAIRKEIQQVNKKLGQTEQIKKHLIVFDQWSTETGEISASQKLRRNSIIQKYAAQIRELYREDLPPDRKKAK